MLLFVSVNFFHCVLGDGCPSPLLGVCPPCPTCTTPAPTTPPTTVTITTTEGPPSKNTYGNITDEEVATAITELRLSNTESTNTTSDYELSRQSPIYSSTYHLNRIPSEGHILQNYSLPLWYNPNIHLARITNLPKGYLPKHLKYQSGAFHTSPNQHMVSLGARKNLLGKPRWQRNRAHIISRSMLIIQRDKK